MILAYEDIRKWLEERVSHSYGSPPIAPGATRPPATLERINNLREIYGQPPMTEEAYVVWRADYMRRAMGSDAAFMGALINKEVLCRPVDPDPGGTCPGCGGEVGVRGGTP